MATSNNGSNCNSPMNQQKEAVAALFGPEEISEEMVAQLQIASGIRFLGLEITLMVLNDRLSIVLDRAWREVRQTLDPEDLWTMAQAAQNMGECSGVGLDRLEQFLGESSAEWDVDPAGAKRLLPKVKAWDMATRWAVLRAVENSIEAAKKRSANGYAIPNRLIEDEFKKELAA